MSYWKQLQNEKRSANNKRIIKEVGIFLIVLIVWIGAMAISSY